MHVSWSSVSHHRVAHRPLRFTSNSVLSNIFSIFYQCLATRLNTVGRLLGTARSGRHLQNITRGTVTLGGASGAPAEILPNMKERYNQDEEKPHDSAKDNEAEAEVES